MARRIDVNPEFLDSDLLVETLDCRRSTAIDRQRDDDKIVAAKLRLEAIERGHLLAARHTPRGPDVQQDHALAKAGYGQSTAVAIGKDNLRKRARLIENGNLLRVRRGGG